MAAPTRFDSCVFLNCPYDAQYLPLLHAIAFAIHDCGFVLRMPVLEFKAGTARMDQIADLVSVCRLSIHDLSRVALDGGTHLPRFNMPFECGLAYGAKYFKPSRGAKTRELLLLEQMPRRHQATLSDLAGHDVKAHDNQPKRVINAVRHFLASQNENVGTANISTRGGQDIWKRYQTFCTQVGKLAAIARIDAEEIGTLDYLKDWIHLAANWQEKAPS